MSNFNTGSIIVIIILIISICLYCYSAYLGYKDRNPIAWKNKDIRSVVISILIYPLLTLFDWAAHILYLIEAYDEGNYWGPDRGPDNPQNPWQDCPGSKSWVFFGIFVMFMYPCISAAFMYFNTGSPMSALHQFTGYNTWMYIKESMQKGVAIFQLWEHKRWQAIIESYLFFLMGIYFVAETLSAKSEDTYPCPVKPGDAFWVWWCIIISGLSLMLVFRQEDLYLIPTILYTTHTETIEDIEPVTFFQDEADHALIVAKDPPNLDKIPLRMNDIITKLGDIDFEQKIEIEDEDKIMDAKSHPKAVLWASERQRLQSTPNIEVKYKREWEHSQQGLNVVGLLLFGWRLCQIACRTLAVVYYFKTESVTKTMAYILILLVVSWSVRLISKQWGLGNNSRVSFMDILFYGMMNALLLDLRYLVRTEIASIPNVMVVCDFLFFYITYSSEKDDVDYQIVVLIAILLVITLVGLALILMYAEVSNYVSVRNRNIAKLLKYDRYQLIEALIVYRAITVDDLGRDSAPKVVLILGENEAVDQNQLVEALYKSHTEYEERVKVLLLKELCIRLQEGLELGQDRHCPRISVDALQNQLVALGVTVEPQIIQKFFDRVNEKEEKSQKHSGKSRENYVTLAPLWQTEQPADKEIRDDIDSLQLPDSNPEINTDPSVYHAAGDAEDPSKRSDTIKKNEVSLDILCGYIIDTPIDRFIGTLSKILFHHSVECNPRVDRALSLHLQEYLTVQKNKSMKPKKKNEVPKMRREDSVHHASQLAVSIEQKLFLRSVPCLKSFKNVQFDKIDKSMETEPFDEKNSEIDDMEMMYVIQRGKVRLEENDEHKFTLSEGDWFGQPMMSWTSPPKFFVEESPVVVLKMPAKEYFAVVEEAKNVDFTGEFIDYTQRQRPDYELINQYKRKKRSDIVTDQQINDPEPNRTPKRRTRKVPDRAKEEEILEVFKCVPSFGCLFQQELRLLARFAITESLKKSSRKSPLEDFLFVTEKGIAKVRRNEQEIDPPLPCRTINLKQMIESGQQFSVQMVGSTPLGMILVPEAVFKIMVKPCMGILETIVKRKDSEIQKPIQWSKRLYKRVKVGAGGFANVFVMEDIASHELIAMKRTSKGHIQANRMFDWVLQEQYCMYMVKHQFVIPLKGSLQDDQFCYFLLDYCPGNSLFHLLMHERLPNPAQDSDGDDGSYYLQEKHARFYAACAILGLEALHTRGIVHRDIKSDNMLIDSDGYLLLTDLGFSKPIGNSKTFTICGTKEYFSPELVNKKGYDFGVDWWALGVAIYDMMTGYIPFDKPRHKLREANIEAGRVSLYLHEHLSHPAKGLIGGLLQFKEGDRFGHKDQGGIPFIKNHNFFLHDPEGKFSWSRLEQRQLDAPWIPEQPKELKQRKQMKDAPFIRYQTKKRSDPFHDYLGTKYKGSVKWASKKQKSRREHPPAN